MASDDFPFMSSNNNNCNVKPNEFSLVLNTSFKWILLKDDIIDAMKNGTIYYSPSFSTGTDKAISWKMQLSFEKMYSIEVKFDHIDLSILKANATYELYLVNDGQKAYIERKQFDTVFCDIDNASTARTFFFYKDLERYGFLDNKHFSILCEIQLKYVTMETTFNQDFKNIYHQNDFSDVTICFESSNEKRRAHKIILAARSPFFFAMFKNDMVEKNGGIVRIGNTDVKVFDQVLQYIYTGSPSKLEGIAHLVLQSAEQYLMQDLKNICELYMINHLSDYDLADVIAFAETCRAFKLKEEAVKFL